MSKYIVILIIFWFLGACASPETKGKPSQGDFTLYYEQYQSDSVNTSLNQAQSINDSVLTEEHVFLVRETD